MKTSLVWFITGCSSGFGAAIARAALEAGDSVVATARDVATLAPLAEHPACLALPLNVADADAITPVLEAALAHFGHIDVLVNNAGVGLLGALEDCSEAEIAHCMEVNFHGPLRLLRALIPHFRQRKRGYILHLSAAAAIANYPGFAIYGAAKAAIETACESLRAELAPYGIRITLIQPGPFRTEFIGRSLRRAACQSPAYEGTVGKFANLLGKMHGRQPGDPARAAALLVTLAHSESAPLRLPLGRYALQKTRQTLTARIHDLDAYEAEAAATDHT